jgi:hypothetical protein
VKDSTLQLMKTVVQVPTKDRKGNPATEFVQILSDTTSTDDDENPVGEVVYSFSTRRSTKHKKGAERPMLTNGYRPDRPVGHRPSRLTW